MDKDKAEKADKILFAVVFGRLPELRAFLGKILDGSCSCDLDVLSKWKKVESSSAIRIPGPVGRSDGWAIDLHTSFYKCTPLAFDMDEQKVQPQGLWSSRGSFQSRYLKAC